MATITGTLDFSITTLDPITHEQFETFKSKMTVLLDEWNTQVLDAADETDFEVEEIEAVSMNEEFNCDFD